MSLPLISQIPKRLHSADSLKRSGLRRLDFSDKEDKSCKTITARSNEKDLNSNWDMSLTTKLLNPIRQSLSPHHFHSPISRSSQLRKFTLFPLSLSFTFPFTNLSVVFLSVRYRFEPAQTWINQLSPSIRYRFTNFILRASHCARSNAYVAGNSVLEK